MNDTTNVADVHAELVAALPRLRRFARTLARNAHDADDLVQVAVERALARIDQWRPDTSLVNWLFGIVRNAWLDEARSRRRRLRVFTAAEEGERVSDPASRSNEQRLAIDAAMAQLPDEQRLVVSLVLVEGLSYKEAADVLQVPIGTLTSRLARARATLVGLLGDASEATP
jgi:RNA polymerase sigma-70 factor (ECF subfamily)